MNPAGIIDGTQQGSNAPPLKVDSTHKGGFGPMKYTAYKIVLRDGNDLYRRFKDFDWLYERLSERLPYMTIPSLPEKVGNKNEEGVVETRRRLLESFLLRLFMLPEVTRTEEFRAFVSPLQREFERVRSGKKNRYILPPLNLNSLSADSTGGRIVSEAHLLECSKRLGAQVRNVGKTVKVCGRMIEFWGKFANSETELGNQLASCGASLDIAGDKAVSIASEASSTCAKITYNFTQEDEAETQGRLNIILRNLERCNELIKRRSKMPDIASISRQSAINDAAYAPEDAASQPGTPQSPGVSNLQENLTGALLSVDMERIEEFSRADLTSLIYSLILRRREYYRQAMEIWDKAAEEMVATQSHPTPYNGLRK